MTPIKETLAQSPLEKRECGFEGASQYPEWHPRRRSEAEIELPKGSAWTPNQQSMSPMTNILDQASNERRQMTHLGQTIALASGLDMETMMHNFQNQIIKIESQAPEEADHTA